MDDLEQRQHIRRLEREIEDLLIDPPTTPDGLARLLSLQWRWSRARFDRIDAEHETARARAQKVDWRTVLAIFAVTAGPAGTVVAALISTSG